MGQLKLETLRRKKGLTQEALADELRVSLQAVGKWVRGEARPHPSTAYQLAQYFGIDDPEELFKPESEPELEQDIVMDYLNKLNRRELLELLGRLSVFAGVDLSILDDPQNVAPEELLNCCRVSIGECWDLLYGGGFSIAESILKQCAISLSNMATHPSKYKHQAALLAVEANIIMMSIAAHKLDYGARELFGLEAVRFGELSRDSNIHVIALGWHGNTYESCYHLPENAIATYNDALPHLSDDAPLSKVDIYIGLAKAYALDKNEKKARDYLELAQTAMPEDPESAPLYRIIRTGQAELDERTGRVYHILAEKFPGEGYAQMAYDTFEKSTNNHAISIGHRGHMLVQKADAARSIGDLDEYIKCLEEGVQTALRFGSKHRINKARGVLRKAPQSWKSEKKYQNLVKLF